MWQPLFRLSAVCVLWSAAHLHATHATEIDYTKQVLPIFEQHCTGCHGEKKGLGKLRLHTIAAIQKKQAADEHLIVAGKPDKSELYERLILPAEHKKRMPKKADPLPQEKIELIRLWIEQGATFQLAAAGVDAAAVNSVTDNSVGGINNPPAAEPQAEEINREPPPLPEVAPADEAAIEKLTAAGAQVSPLFANSPLLQVSFALRGEPATDADLAQLAAVAKQTYALNLAAAQISDQGLAVVSQLTNLAQLHLENSSVTDTGLASLSNLQNLKYLNLYGTTVTDAGLPHLHGLKHLRNLYLWKTKVSYDAARALEKTIPDLAVNLGFDHPVVARKRLGKELERAQENAQEAAATAEKVKQEFEAATKANEEATKNLESVEKALEVLKGEGKTEPDEKKPEEKKAEEPAKSDEKD
jgi:mono/diheme cytochrome c family protein